MVQSHRWTTIRWWNEHSKISSVSLVRPPLLRGVVWCTWHAAGGWKQPGAAQWRSRRITARRRWGGMVSAAAPRSRGRLMVAAGPARVPVRSSEATCPGPDSNATALARMRLLTVSRSGAASPLARRSLAASLSSRSSVDAAGDDRDDGGVAGISGRGGWPERPGFAGPVLSLVIGASAGPVVSLAAGAFSDSGAGWLRAWPVPGSPDRRRPGRRRVRWPG